MAMRAGEIPVPIPNTTVKPCTADGTILATVWKNRRLPDLYKKDRRWPAMRDQERGHVLRDSGFLMTGQRGDPKTVRRPCLLRGTRCPEEDLDNRIMENINLPKIYVMKCEIFNIEHSMRTSRKPR